MPCDETSSTPPAARFGGAPWKAAALAHWGRRQSRTCMSQLPVSTFCPDGLIAQQCSGLRKSDSKVEISNQNAFQESREFRIKIKVGNRVASPRPVCAPDAPAGRRLFPWSPDGGVNGGVHATRWMSNEGRGSGHAKKYERQQ